MTLPPTSLPTGMDSPVTIDSSSEERALGDFAVNRHLFAWSDTQPIANLQRGDLNFFVGPIGADTAGRLGSEV